MVLGATQDDFLLVDEQTKPFADFDISSAQDSGFPLKYEGSNAQVSIKLMPLILLC